MKIENREWVFVSIIIYILMLYLLKFTDYFSLPTIIDLEFIKKFAFLTLIFSLIIPIFIKAKESVLIPIFSIPLIIILFLDFRLETLLFLIIILGSLNIEPKEIKLGWIYGKLKMLFLTYSLITSLFLSFFIFTNELLYSEMVSKSINATLNYMDIRRVLELQKEQYVNIFQYGYYLGVYDTLQSVSRYIPPTELLNLQSELESRKNERISMFRSELETQSKNMSIENYITGYLTGFKEKNPKILFLMVFLFVFVPIKIISWIVGSIASSLFTYSILKIFK